MRNEKGQFVKGGSGFSGNHTKESRKKMSKAKKTNPTKYWLGKKRGQLSLETRKKMSESHKGKKAYQWKGGKPNCIDCDKKLTKYKSVRCKICHEKNISDNLLFSGENNPNWKGGITSENDKLRKTRDYVIWRTAVFIRDDYTCQECGERGVTLHAHHVKPFSKYPELRFAIDNGKTLCVECHRQTETWGGRGMSKQTEGPEMYNLGGIV
jgi:hypothetical protein